MATERFCQWHKIQRRFFASKLRLAVLSALIAVFLVACSTTDPLIGSRRRPNPPRGFFEKLMDQVTERQCNVGRFICPYGFGRADEPCDCTDPNGVVLNGRTVK